jgi:hypothetical protein
MKPSPLPQTEGLSQNASTDGHFATTHWDKDPPVVAGVVVSGDGTGEVWVWVPGASLLSSRVERYWHDPRRLERLWVILHVVLERQAYGDETYGFSPISCRRLEEFVGRDFACSGLSTLVEARFLETDGRFCPERKCKGYRFTQDIAMLAAEPCLLSDALGARFRSRRAAWSNRAIGDNLAHQLLWHHLQTLTLHPSAKGSLPLPGVDIESRLKRSAWFLSLDYVNRRHWYFCNDPKTGRVFNNFTNMPKVLRGYALLDGQPCAEIDIRNSQPFFLAGMYPRDCPEKRHYLAIVSEGQFYEELNKASGCPFVNDKRDELKKAVYVQVLYGRRWADSPLWAGFEDLFPMLSRIVAERKSKDYRQLAIEMQRLEASVMIGLVVPRLAETFPGVPFLTVHDSLTVPHELASEAATLLENTVEEAAGHKPALRINQPAPFRPVSASAPFASPVSWRAHPPSLSAWTQGASSGSGSAQRLR